MASTNGTYPTNARSKFGRLAKRGTYDTQTVHAVLSSAPIMHVAFTPTHQDPFPTILPMIGALGSFESKTTAIANPEGTGALDLYLHGYVSARLMRLAGHAANLDEGLPVAVCATSVDGLVMALTPFHHSMNYRSAVVHGYAYPVTDEAEKLWAMQQVTEVVCADRWDHSRVPPTKTELTTTGILRVVIESASAKVRTGSAGDDKEDEENPEVRGKVWTGVVPSYQRFGEPVAAKENTVPLPQYLREYIDKTNKRNETYANDAPHKAS